MAKQKIKGSDLFSVEEIEGKKYLHVEFQVEIAGKIFDVRNVQESDKAFYEQWFGNKEIVEHYGDGQPKDAKWVGERFDAWNKRFYAGQPHGGLTVVDNETKKPIGQVVAGGGSEGAAELAAVFDVSWQNKLICTHLLDAVVKIWAPEVRKIGLKGAKDSGLDFRCFDPKNISKDPHPGVLRRLDSTYSPLDTASAKALKRAGFVMAMTHLSADKAFDLSATELSCTNMEDLEEITRRFFDVDIGRVANQRYKFIDRDGEEHTLSFKENFGSFRFHVEKEIGR